MPSRSPVIVAATFFLVRYASSLPLESTTTVVSNGTDLLVGYVSDPPGRGTSSLVLSCLVTLILCVWSALHLNVPPPGQSTREAVYMNVTWITAGIYAPELVVFTAWRQWSSAKILTRSVQRTVHGWSSSKQRKVLSSNPWTMTHSFFASTGGFAIDCSPYIGDSESLKCFLPEGTPARLTVTAKGIEFLATRGILPDIPREVIDDKSKADAIAKSIVLLQASWILLQTLGRLVAGLPVTLLEVNTVAHVLCALFMYAMWWYKPLLAREPILISSDILPQLLPYMYLSSEISGQVDSKRIKSQTIIKTWLASLNLYSRIPKLEYICFRSGGSQTETDSLSRCLRADEECNELMRQRSSEKDSTTAFFERRPRLSDSQLKDLADKGHDEKQLTALAKMLLDDTLTVTESHKHLISGGTLCRHFKSEPLLVNYSRNWPSDELLRTVDGLVVGIVLWFANFLYGAIHISAWNDHFPSVTEKWMWRISAIYICFCGGFWVLLNLAVKKHRPLNLFWEKLMDGEQKVVKSTLLSMLVVICGSSFIVSRAYIVVEAFMSIRNLPISAYKTPDWTDLFPHL